MLCSEYKWRTPTNDDSWFFYNYQTVAGDGQVPPSGRRDVPRVSAAPVRIPRKDQVFDVAVWPHDVSSGWRDRHNLKHGTCTDTGRYPYGTEGYSWIKTIVATVIYTGTDLIMNVSHRTPF